MALPTGQNLPSLTLPQQQLLDSNIAESRSIDRALEQIDDWALQGEVQRFRTLTAHVTMLHDHTLNARYALAASTQDLQDSVARLSCSDIYVQIQQALENEEDEFIWLATADLHTTMKKVARRPVKPTDNYCRWCQHKGHNEVDCWIFQQCRLCDRFGHITENCCTPHRLCSVTTGCNVPMDHSGYRHDCKARLYFMDKTLGFAFRLNKDSSRIKHWLDSI